jgi:hypothetical protein
MINVIVWAIFALLIYAGLKAFEAKVNGVPFEEGLGEESQISQTEAVLVACIAPLGTLLAIACVLYLFFDFKKNPFETIVVGISKIVRQVMGIPEPVKDEDE